MVGVEARDVVRPAVAQPADGAGPAGGGRDPLEPLRRAGAGRCQVQGRRGRGRVGQAEAVLVGASEDEVLAAVGQPADRGAAAGQVGHPLAGLEAVAPQPDRVGGRVHGRPPERVEVEDAVAEEELLPAGRGHAGEQVDRRVRGVERRHADVVGVHDDDQVRAGG